MIQPVWTICAYWIYAYPMIEYMPTYDPSISPPGIYPKIWKHVYEITWFDYPEYVYLLFNAIIQKQKRFRIAHPYNKEKQTC